MLCCPHLCLPVWDTKLTGLSLIKEVSPALVDTMFNFVTEITSESLFWASSSLITDLEILEMDCE